MARSLSSIEVVLAEVVAAEELLEVEVLGLLPLRPLDEDEEEKEEEDEAVGTEVEMVMVSVGVAVMVEVKVTVVVETESSTPVAVAAGLPSSSPALLVLSSTPSAAAAAPDEVEPLVEADPPLSSPVLLVLSSAEVVAAGEALLPVMKALEDELVSSLPPSLPLSGRAARLAMPVPVGRIPIVPMPNPVPVGKMEGPPSPVGKGATEAVEEQSLLSGRPGRCGRRGFSSSPLCCPLWLPSSLVGRAIAEDRAKQAAAATIMFLPTILTDLKLKLELNGWEDCRGLTSWFEASVWSERVGKNPKDRCEQE